MAPDSPALKPVATPALPTRPRQKYRLRFRKDGDLRLVSHHDLMHCFERMLRRAGLPFAVTQGFHPTPRIVFAQALALGLVGHAEVVEIELMEELPGADVFQRLAQQTPPGLTFHSVHGIDLKTTARVRRACYQTKLPVDQGIPWAQRSGELLAQEHLWVQRLRPRPRRFNLRPLLSELTVLDDVLTMWLWITPNGAARPEEVVRLLGGESVIEAGTVMERTQLELADEVGPDAPAPPDLSAATGDQVIVVAVSETNSTRESTAPRPAALISGPLAFDS